MIELAPQHLDLVACRVQFVDVGLPGLADGLHVGAEPGQHRWIKLDPPFVLSHGQSPSLGPP
ncbi:hypothetical protein CO675_11940 [Bradyrhizobium sp. C9]|nr:hypothetical protein CO675_11940 [Bradyrhizobium sp. C9]